jgi:tyrosyl-tRNA synthetase
MFIPDGRITPDGLSKILNEINCTAWITTREEFSPIKGQESYILPSLEEMISQDEDDARQYAYDETWEQAKDDIVCIIHTSGTTGTKHQIDALFTKISFTYTCVRSSKANLPSERMDVCFGLDARYIAVS